MNKIRTLKEILIADAKKHLEADHNNKYIQGYYNWASTWDGTSGNM